MKKEQILAVAHKTIQEMRTEMIVYLSKQPHIASETQGIFIYPTDLSGRLTKLQAIVGQFPLQIGPHSLWDLQDDNQLITVDKVTHFIQALKATLAPVDQLPPAKRPFTKMINAAVYDLHLIRMALVKEQLEKEEEERERQQVENFLSKTEVGDNDEDLPPPSYASVVHADKQEVQDQDNVEDLPPPPSYETVTKSDQQNNAPKNSLTSYTDLVGSVSQTIAKSIYSTAVTLFSDALGVTTTEPTSNNTPSTLNEKRFG